MMENNYKSDKISWSLGISDLKKLTSNMYFNKLETYRLAYNMTVECIEMLFDPKTHKTGQKINANNPKNVVEIQCLVNLTNWQLRMNRKKLFQQFELDKYVADLKNYKTDKSMLTWKAL